MGDSLLLLCTPYNTEINFVSFREFSPNKFREVCNKMTGEEEIQNIHIFELSPPDIWEMITRLASS